MPQPNWERVPIEPQAVDAPLSRAAVFLTVTVQDAVAARSVIGGIDDLVKTVGFRDLNAHLSCNVGIGAGIWPTIVGGPLPAGLHPFEQVVGAVHTAVSTPGDLFFHIRAERPDFCFEFERLLLDALGDAVTVVDEVQGFRYFDSRDLLGFVDGTANPVGVELARSARITDPRDPFAGGSHIVVQKYLHDLDAWGRLSTSEQEAVIGRTKADNVELDDAPAGAQAAHKTLATITDADGTEHDILRDNMPFGRPGEGEFGTYFIGYAADVTVIEKMLQRMFIGVPAGKHDRILDVSRAVTGAQFFAPSQSMLASLGD